MSKPITQIATRVVAAACMVAAFAGYAQQEQVEDTIKLMVGSMHKIEPKFAVERFLVGGNAVKVLDMPDGTAPITVRAEKVGIGDVQLIGAGGVSAKYRFSVDEVGLEVPVLRRLLEPVPSVEVTAVGNQIVIEGTVSDPDQWRHLMKVAGDYKGRVSNYAKFQPPDEWLMQVQQGLEHAGFKVVPLSDKAVQPTGTLKLGMRGNSLYVSGIVFNDKDIKRVRDVVAVQDWVELPKVDDTGKEKDNQKVDRQKMLEEGRILAIVNVNTKPSVLVTVDIAVLAIDDKIMDEAGMNLFKQGLLAVDGSAAALTEIIHGGGNNMGARAGVGVGTSINGTLKAFGGDSLGRKVTRATVAPFESGDPEGGSYQLGGTLKVRLASPLIVGTASAAPQLASTAMLADIDYGLIVKTAGDMVDDDTMALKIDFELSYPLTLENGDFDVKKNKAASRFKCDLGKTMILAGVSELAQTAEKEGVPYLRSIPVVGYFFSERNSEKKKDNVLVLISPRLADAARDGTIDIDDIRNTEEQSAIDSKERIKQLKK